LAAANRGRYVVENFQQTPAVPDGLAVMAEAYHLLGLHDLSADAVKVLAANYPEYPAFAEDGSFQYPGISPGDSKPWIRRLTPGLYDSGKPPRFDTRRLYCPTALAEPEEMMSIEGEENSGWRWFTCGLVK